MIAYVSLAAVILTRSAKGGTTSVPGNGRATSVPVKSGIATGPEHNEEDTNKGVSAIENDETEPTIIAAVR